MAASTRRLFFCFRNLDSAKISSIRPKTNITLCVNRICTYSSPCLTSLCRNNTSSNSPIGTTNFSKNFSSGSKFKTIKEKSQKTVLKLVNYHEHSRRECHDGDDSLEPRRRSSFKLMNFPELLWPVVRKSIRNWFLSRLISSYYDDTFTVKTFMSGASQAIEYVSSCISRGEFSALEGLVASDAIDEIRNNYKDMSVDQRMKIAISPSDMFLQFVYETGMMFDDDTEERFVEITVVYHGYHGFGALRQQGSQMAMNELTENKDKVYVCNYRFTREYTKGVESEWTITKLNHFYPSDYTGTMAVKW